MTRQNIYYYKQTGFLKITETIKDSGEEPDIFIGYGKMLVWDNFKNVSIKASISLVLATVLLKNCSGMSSKQSHISKNIFIDGMARLFSMLLIYELFISNSADKRIDDLFF